MVNHEVICASVAPNACAAWKIITALLPYDTSKAATAAAKWAGEKEAAVDLYIIVEYGVRIPDIALTVQEKVKSAIENMTGLEVVEVNVHVQGVGFVSEEVEDVRVR